jgi:protein-S-isoprenylcysteine O-methyltransferase Ste14
MILLGLAVLLFFLGGRHYDASQLMGFKQIKEGTSHKVITDTGDLDTSGVLSITRHPWYLATILFIWARQLDVSAILVNIILTSYLIVGTWLEEKKLIEEFGEKYLAYQKRVSMLLPYKWLKLKILDLVSGKRRE